MVIDQLSVWLTVALVVCGTCIASGGCFVIPKARFEVLRPYGLRVSIPDVAGIKLFSFHGAVNDEIQVNQQGIIHGDVTEAIDGRWTFTDRTVAVKGDDVINYWIYVQFNNLGYHTENKQLVMEALNATLESKAECSCCTPIHHHYHYHYYNLPDDGASSGGNSTRQSHQQDMNWSETVANLQQQVNRTVGKLDYLLGAKINPLEEELGTLKDMVNFIQKRLDGNTANSNLPNELLLIGSFPAQIPSLIDYLNDFMREKLAVMNIQGKIVRAHQPTVSEIVFEVSTMADKLLLLRTAKEMKLIAEAGYLLVSSPPDP
ncbi:uncharacterized protein LOC132262194 [Phlebotomus argentipes]|uniref:uncharacterized protein LOC132262194 n=1 Tax=Phlebotomus argentipes TaxID=94469 RepID=UPI0028933813|nr:uncharacterized protein LOC132262194 [Phlebotomus argentipes]